MAFGAQNGSKANWAGFLGTIGKNKMNPGGMYGDPGILKSAPGFPGDPGFAMTAPGFAGDPGFTMTAPGFAGDPGFTMTAPGFPGDPGFTHTPWSGFPGSGNYSKAGPTIGGAKVAYTGGSVAGSGVSGPGGTVAGGTGTVQTNPGTGTANPAQPNSGLAYGGLYGSDFQFDPANDPTYQAAVKLAQSAADDASRSTMETMNDRGLLNSSVTTSQLGQIKQKAELEPLKLIPQLQQQALAQYNTDRLYPLQQAAITGKYLPQEAQDAIDAVVNAKSEWPTATKERQEVLRKIGVDARAKLDRMGYDSSKLGSTVGMDQANKNAGQFGQLTADSQKTLMGVLAAFPGMYGSFAKGTGNLVGDLPLYAGLEDMFKGVEGVQTMDYKKFVAEMGQIGLRNQGEKLSQAAQAQNMDYTAWLHKNNIAKDDAEKATNKYLSDIAALVGTTDASGKIIDREALFRKFAKDQPNLLRDGVKVQDVITAINTASFQDNKVSNPNSAGGNPNNLPNPNTPWVKN